MRLSEAYSILGVNQTSSQDEIKKKYKDLTKKYHPDVNKDADAESHFKKINEAYNVIQKGEPEEANFNYSSAIDPFSIFNGSFRRAEQREHVNIVISTNISFQESILGVKRDISFNRKGKCQSCGGHGSSILNNGCDQCKGVGRITNRQGNMVSVQTCPKCLGRTKVNKCEPCDGEGSLDTRVNISVTIPGGVSNGNVLRLSGMGNYMGQGSFMGFATSDHFTDVHLHINVSQDPEMFLENKDVVSKLKVSLLDSLQGCKRTVRTVLGEKEIVIEPLSKNKDEITIYNAGVNRVGHHKIILDVSYPDNAANLISFLKNEVP